jgi:hypothetical protein
MAEIRIMADTIIIRFVIFNLCRILSISFILMFCLQFRPFVELVLFNTSQIVTYIFPQSGNISQKAGKQRWRSVKFELIESVNY